MEYEEMINLLDDTTKRRMLLNAFNAFKSGLFPINQHKEEDSKY